MRDAKVNVAYRWFLGYTMSQSLPHFATISYAFCHRFTAEVIGVFRWMESGSGGISVAGGGICGRNAHQGEHEPEEAREGKSPVAAKRYQEQLDAEIEADRAAHGKKPLKKKDDDDGDSTPARQKTVTKSTTDLNSARVQRASIGNASPMGLLTVCDRAGLCAGNGGHARQCPTTASPLTRCLSVSGRALSSAGHRRRRGHKTPWICKQVFDSGEIPSLPYKRPMTKKETCPQEYVYDEYYDCVLCPQNQILSYSTAIAMAARYKSKVTFTKNCPSANAATENQQCTKTVTGMSGTTT